jgi:Fe-S cluster assembly protein SufD
MKQKETQLTVTKRWQIDQPHQTVELNQAGVYLIELVESGSSVEVKGRLQLSGNQQEQVNLIIDHQAPKTEAEVDLRGVVVDQAQLDLTGKIIIQPDCSQVKSELDQKILILSPRARATAIPELEIMNDQVECSHSAAISDISSEQLFYLQSRGLSYDQAREMIVKSFLNLNSPDH